MQRPGGFTYQPALDGVRGVSVALVLLFHAGFGWMSGGYVGVSVFFTLSGYLITSLALIEHDRSGRLDVGAFYARRTRRILPASLLCIAAVVIAGWLHQFEGVTRLRRDIWAALGQVYNWVVLAGRDTYAEQVSRAAGQRAPLDHYWSLAIEEQFYWLWPLALVAGLRLARSRRQVAVVALWLGTVGAAVVVAIALGGDAAYFATPARLPEILAGAVIAVGLHHRVVPGNAAWLGVIGVGAIIVCAGTWPASGGPAEAGLLPAFAVASAALIVGLQVPSSLRTALSLAPIVWLGRVSYGVYLYHWPVYTIVDERRVDVGRVPLFGIRLAITLAAATASFYLVERPIRFRRFEWRPVAGVAAASCIAVAAIVVTVPDRGGNYTEVADATIRDAAIPPVEDGESLPALIADDGGDLNRPVRVMIMGDSTAVSTANGMIQWAAEHRDVMRVTSRAAVACGLNPIATPDDGYQDVCEAVFEGHVPSVRRLQPDVIVAMVTFRDMEDRQWNEAEGTLSPTDPRFRQHLLDGYEWFTTLVLQAGADHVVWVIPPTPDVAAVGNMAVMMEPSRFDAYRRVVRALQLSFPEDLTVIDMAAWVDGLQDRPGRKDGLHWTLDGAVEVAAEFLVPAILETTLHHPDQPAS